MDKTVLRMSEILRSRARRGTALLLAALLLCFWTTFTVQAAPDWPAGPALESESGIVMDADSGAVLYGQRIHLQEAPASITKLLTALVVLEHAGLQETVTYSHDAVYNVEGGSGNKCQLEEGDQLSVEDALYLLLLVSSNQSANALAEHVAGSRADFVELMNEKCRELGCEDSHFANPSGLNDDTQLTSSYDMALIARAAYDNETLLKIGSATERKLAPTINNPGGRTIRMEHKLIVTANQEDPNYYPYAVAGKTGYTSVAGQTLVTYAVKDNRRLIAVTMKSTQKTHYSDTIALLNFGFDRFKNIRVKGERDDELFDTDAHDEVKLGDHLYAERDLMLEDDAVITLPNEGAYRDAEKALSEKADIPADAPAGAVGYMQYSYNDRVVGGSYVISKRLASGDTTVITGNPSTAGERIARRMELIGGRFRAIWKSVRRFFRETAAALGAMSWPQRLLALGEVLLPAVIILGGIWIFAERRRSRRARDERRTRRQQRLADLGLSEEDFARILEERREKR